MTVSEFSYSFYYRVVQFIFIFVFGSVFIFMCGLLSYLFVKALVVAPPILAELGPLIRTILPFLLAACMLLVVPTLGLFWGLCAVLTMFPTVSVREDAFKIASPAGSTPWLPWSAISKVRRIPLPRQSWMIGIKGLNRIYWLGSLTFWMGVASIHLTPSIQEYDRLMAILREKRPDLFY